MRYSEIIARRLESAEQREWRLGIMYGTGASEGEWDAAEFEQARLKNDLDAAKVRQTDAETLASLADLFDDAVDAEEDWPWPQPGGRCMTGAERAALRARMSRVAGKMLPPFEEVERPE